VNSVQEAENQGNLVVAEAENDEEALDGYFDNGLANESSSEKHAEGNQEVAAEEPSQVKQRVWNL